MKALKIILIAIVSIVLIAAIVGYMQPREVKLTVSKVIDAPMCVLFDNVNDLSKRVEWSPWEKMDSTIVTTIGETSAGLGASYSWTSEGSGDGKLTYVEVKENELLKSKLEFGNENPAFATFLFKQVEDGVEVSWSFEGDFGGAFYQRLMGVIMKPVLETTFTNGLEHLSEYAKADENNPCLTPSKPMTMVDHATIIKNGEGIGVHGEIVEMEIPGTAFVSVVDSCEPTSPNIAALIGGSYGKLVPFVESAGIRMEAAPFVRYHKWEPPTKVVMEPSIVVKSELAETPEGIISSAIPAGKVVMGTHFGAYDKSEEVWNAVMAYIKENGFEEAGYPWHEYVTDPGVETDTNKWESRIYIPIK